MNRKLLTAGGDINEKSGSFNNPKLRKSTSKGSSQTNNFKKFNNGVIKRRSSKTSMDSF